MEKHTPGPWRAGSQIIESENTKAIVVFSENVMRIQDARLIASAPELLDCLKRTLEELRLIRMKDCGAVYDVSCRIDAERVIAQAEGRS